MSDWNSEQGHGEREQRAWPSELDALRLRLAAVERERDEARDRWQVIDDSRSAWQAEAQANRGEADYVIAKLVAVIKERDAVERQRDEARRDIEHREVQVVERIRAYLYAAGEDLLADCISDGHWHGIDARGAVRALRGAR